MNASVLNRNGLPPVDQWRRISYRLTEESQQLAGLAQTQSNSAHQLLRTFNGPFTQQFFVRYQRQAASLSSLIDAMGDEARVWLSASGESHGPAAAGFRRFAGGSPISTPLAVTIDPDAAERFAWTSMQHLEEIGEGVNRLEALRSSVEPPPDWQDLLRSPHGMLRTHSTETARFLITVASRARAADNFTPVTPIPNFFSNPFGGYWDYLEKKSQPLFNRHRSIADWFNRLNVALGDLGEHVGNDIRTWASDPARAINDIIRWQQNPEQALFELAEWVSDLPKEDLAGLMLELLDATAELIADTLWQLAEWQDQSICGPKAPELPLHLKPILEVIIPIIAPGIPPTVFNEGRSQFNKLWNEYYVPLEVNKFFLLLDPLFDDSANGTPGGSLTSRSTEIFRTDGTNNTEKGTAAVSQSLSDTINSELIREDEAQLIKHDNGTYTLVLPGVTDLSSPNFGLNEHHDSSRDTNRAATKSAASTDVEDNEYALLIREFVAENVPTGSKVAIVGHSFGADTALDLSADPVFNGEMVQVTHVVAAAYDSGPQLSAVQNNTEVLTLRNNKDVVVIAENLGHLDTIKETCDENSPKHHEKTFSGSWKGAGHHPDNYADYVEQTDDTEVNDFMASWADNGYAASGQKQSFDVSMVLDEE